HMRDRMPRVACIGPAGEKQALLANIISEVRAAGRGGAGAVMGSKNLKAIVVVGHKYGPDDFVYDKEKFMEAVRETSKLLSESKITGPRVRGALSIYGTANIIDGINAAGGWPTKNFQTGIFEKVKEVNGPSFGREIWIPPDSPGARPCYACQILCAHAAVIRDGKYAGTFDEGPEYETIWAFGPQCGVSDKKAITRADYLSDYYGLDTISLGNTIGFLMECYERGLITKEDTDGIDLRFGNAGALVEVVHRAGTMEGNIGKLAANGTKRAAEKIGKGSEKFAIHVKGLELPAYDPRAAQGMGLCYARSDRGACHLRPWTAGAEMLGLNGVDPRKTEGKAELVKTASEVFAVAYDSTGLCLFMAFGAPADKVYKMVNHATGFNYESFEEFVKVGERIHNLTRAFNVREGFTRKDDTLPWRILNEPLPEGPCKGDVVKLDEMLPEYYKLCGWDEEGRPTKEKLKELGLDFAIKELYGE
ncbi:TPA: aldehyde:ferredoxin oxidoreductase, partial [Candidatus Bathyarchaeota archaeon]|nr:aldehyde:ferredoxin oxidoreductase [Candidatus Bathyarchaeota archaeon]